MIYFDNAATTFIKPKSVIQEMINSIKNHGNPGRGGYPLSLNASQKIFNTRLSIANFFGSASPERVIFTANATTSLNMAIKCFIKPNSHIIISCFEHNSVFRPVNTLSKAGCEYDIADISTNLINSANSESSGETANNDRTIANVLDLIKDNTSMIVLTHVSNVCGKILPIGDIIQKVKEKKPDIIAVVDAAQSAGVLDIDINRDKIDILCVPAHKNMFGVSGLGVMVLNDSIDVSQSRTFTEGGTGINSLDSFMPDDVPERFEPGTPNTPAIAALSAGIEYISSETLEKIRIHEKLLHDRAVEMLKNLKNITLYSGFSEEGYIGPILFNAKGYKCEAAAKILIRNEIYVRDGYHCSPLAHNKLGTIKSGGVRISMNYHNKPTELEKFYKVIRSL